MSNTLVLIGRSIVFAALAFGLVRVEGAIADPEHSPDAITSNIRQRFSSLILIPNPSEVYSNQSYSKIDASEENYRVIFESRPDCGATACFRFQIHAKVGGTIESI